MVSSTHPILQLSGIEKVYGTPDHPLVVLREVDLEINEGEFVAIIGPSGAGKSTLLNILGCLDRPTSGSYMLMGEDVAHFDDQKLTHVRKQRLGFVFQSSQLISHLTVLENVAMPLFYARQPRYARNRRCCELLERVGLTERMDHLPNQLSGGESQRAAIARALANDPALILADEPTGNLDTATSREIMALIHELHESGRTVVLITHNTDISRAAPRRVTLRDGQIEADTGRETPAHDRS